MIHIYSRVPNNRGVENFPKINNRGGRLFGTLGYVSLF